MLWTNTLWCELHAYCVNKQHMVQTNFSLVWSLKLWCDHTFVLKLGMIHTLWVWSHHLWVWAYHQYGVITTHVFPSTHVFPWWKLMFTSNEAWLFALLILWDFTIEKYFCEIKVFLRKRHRSGSATRLRCPRRGGRPISSLFMRRTWRDWTCITKVLDA